MAEENWFNSSAGGRNSRTIGKLNSGDNFLDQLMNWNTARENAIRENKDAGGLPFGSSPSSVDLRQKQQAQALRDNLPPQDMPQRPVDASTSIMDQQAPGPVMPENQVTPPSTVQPPMPPPAAPGPAAAPAVGAPHYGQKRMSKIDELVDKMANQDPGNYADALRGNERMGTIMKLMGNKTFSDAGDSLIGMEANRRGLEAQEYQDERGKMTDQLSAHQLDRQYDVDYLKAQNTGKGRGGRIKRVEFEGENGQMMEKYFNDRTGDETDPMPIGDTRLDQKLQIADEEAMVARQQAATGNSELSTNLELMNKILNSGVDLNLGWWEDMQQQVAPMLGISTEGMRETAVLEMIMSKFVIPEVKKLGFNPSNVDLKFIEKSVPNKNSDEQTWMDWVQRQQRAISRAEEMRKWEDQRYRETGQRPKNHEYADRLNSLVGMQEDEAYIKGMSDFAAAGYSSQGTGLTRAVQQTVLQDEPAATDLYRSPGVQGPGL